MEFDAKKFFSRLFTVTCLLAFAFPALYVITAIRRTAATGDPSLGTRAEIVGYGFFLVASFYLFGLYCSWKFSGAMGTSFADFLFYPRKYLKTPPVILSRQQGLISTKRYQEAELELLELRGNLPGSPEISWMLITLHTDIFRDIESAIADCRFFLLHRKWRWHELNLPILLRYADLLCQTGQIKEARKILRKESKASFYSPNERKAIKSRLEAVTEMLEETSE